MSKQEVKEKKLTGGLFWNPEVNEEIVGRLVAIREGSYKHDVYDIQTDKGIVTVPSSSVLEGLNMKDLLDKKLRIKMLGWGKDKLVEKKPNLYRNFEVFLIEE